MAVADRAVGRRGDWRGRGGNASGQKRSHRASLAATLRGQGGGRVVAGAGHRVGAVQGFFSEFALYTTPKPDISGFGGKGPVMANRRRLAVRLARCKCPTDR